MSAPKSGTLDLVYEGRLLGFTEGWDARQAEIDRLNDECDRLYRAAYNPRELIKQGRSYAELQATRRALYFGGVS